MLKNEVAVKIWPDLIMSSPDLIVPFPVNRFSMKLAPNVTNIIIRNPPFCSFARFLIVLQTPVINKQDSSRYLTIFMISLISPFKIINVAVREGKSEGRVLDPNIFLRIAAFIAAAAINSYGIKAL